MKPMILMYHRVADLAAGERYTVSPAQFSRQMRYLREQRYDVINLSTLMDWLAGSTSLAGRSIVVTFDDGFLDTYEHACPVLCDYGFKATFFMISGLVGKTNTWMTSRGDPSTPLMGWREIENLKRCGYEVGSHAVTHRDLTEISLDEAKDELDSSKQTLEDRLCVPINFFAYPYGCYNSKVRELVREAGYTAACTTAPGFIDPVENNFELRRVEVSGTDSLRTFAQKMEFGTKQRSYTDLARYYARRVVAKTFGR